MGKDKRQSPSTLLWFIRHKSYVPISELRRRFYADAEEGCFIDAGKDRRAFVGLPRGTAQSIEKLWQQGKIGFEFSVEFDADVLIGVYPMNPSKEDMNGYGYAYGHGQNRSSAPQAASGFETPTGPAANQFQAPISELETGWPDVPQIQVVPPADVQPQPSGEEPAELGESA
jgi:hypothetical protein